MATETVKSSAHKEVSGAPIPPKNNAELGVQNPNDTDQTGTSSARPLRQQQEQQQLSQQQSQRRLSPFVITGRPEEKHLGISARNLAVSDFALLRTLGTGQSDPKAVASYCRSEKLLTMDFLFLIDIGTFARVWLTRFKTDERKDRVYALKILRKADGMALLEGEKKKKIDIGKTPY